MPSAFARTLSKTRVVVLLLLSIFSLALLISNGQFAHTLMKDGNVTIAPFISFNLAVSVMTMVTLLVMLIVGFVGQDPFTSWIVIEISWLGFLNILWLASSAYTSSQWQPLARTGVCSSGKPLPADFATICTDFQASMAFGWMGWILMSAYWGTLLAFAINSAKNGEPVWKSTLKTAGSGKAASTEFGSSLVFQPVKPRELDSASTIKETV
ncbi:hypothetical protein PHLGIDRAFT_37108 [Phlebiopsis gigantea 11061_1 CR5-6]|uniref:MARVEL domain-containing protein n=1 Tax=Phlebiopsis gigantea (strain 11061_1 CR5-6) TaxID=745531 RepID=A0A0C3S2Y0_PHLG1|nr:hypothetical protein PHLGIDRAFT_37108 [Phlebiopsis gigantea 11061_1 CR5-6]